MEHRVLVADPIGELGLALLSAAPGVVVDAPAALEPSRLCERVAGASVLIVRSRTRVTPSVLEAGSSLMMIVRAGTGTDNIDLEAASERGIPVLNTPGANANAAAEHAFAMLLAMARQLPAADRHVKAGGFDKQGFAGCELAGKTLGVVGLGRVGVGVARFGAAFGMEVLGCDPLLAGESAPCPLVGLDELLARADFVSLHLPLSQETRHLLDRERLARMKPGARLVNCARGGLIDEPALLEALELGRLAGAALDVFETEPKPLVALVARDDVIATPHLGAQTVEAAQAVGRMAAEQVLEGLGRNLYRNCVNPEVLAGR